MPTASVETAEAILDRRRLHALGVLLPIRLSGLSFFSGRHPLGRAGEGMRFLRTRPFEPGEDNPRDIDRFSPPGELLVTEWEAEAQASVLAYADVSASMRFPPHAALMNLALLQLTYSLWRAGDRVRTILYSKEARTVVESRNLKSQLDKLIRHLDTDSELAGEDAVDVMMEHAARRRRQRTDLIFIMSDFQTTAGGVDQADSHAWHRAIRAVATDVVPIIVSFVLPEEQRGAIRFWDGERCRHALTLLTPARIRRINADESARVAGLVRCFRQLGMDHIVLRSAHDVYPELAKLARWRRQRV